MDTFGAHSTKSPEADGDGADGGERERRKSEEEEEGGGEGSSSTGRRSSDGAEEEVGESSSGGSRTNVRNSIPPSLPIQLTHSLEMLLSKGNYVHCPNPQCKVRKERKGERERRGGGKGE